MYYKAAGKCTESGNQLLNDFSPDGQPSFSASEYAFLQQIKVLQALAEKSGCVIVGRCAAHLFTVS
ncbi:MAG: cytidylate kinase-like family protein [Clostridiales bacterium]|nr:cytidylate kinase-like family protein [Clostridiales bacterium]